MYRRNVQSFEKSDGSSWSKLSFSPPSPISLSLPPPLSQKKRRKKEKREKKKRRRGGEGRGGVGEGPVVGPVVGVEFS